MLSNLKKYVLSLKIFKIKFEGHLDVLCCVWSTYRAGIFLQKLALSGCVFSPFASAVEAREAHINFYGTLPASERVGKFLKHV
jgi:hypothetical protein